MQLSRSAVLALREEGPSSSLEVMRTGVVPPTRSLEAAYSDHGGSSTHHHHHDHHPTTTTTSLPNNNSTSILEDTEELVSLMRRDLEWMVSETRAALEANHNTRTAIDTRNDALREQLLKEVGQQQHQQHHSRHQGIKRVVSSHSTVNEPHTTTRQASPSLPPSYEAVLHDAEEEDGLRPHSSSTTTINHHQPTINHHSSRRYVVGVGALESPPRPSNRDGLPYKHPHHYNPPAGATTNAPKPPAPPTTRPSPLSTYFEEEGGQEHHPDIHEGHHPTNKMFQMEFSPPSRAPTNDNKVGKQQAGQRNIRGGGTVARRPVLTSELQGLRREYESYATTTAPTNHTRVGSSRRSSSERPPPPPTHQPNNKRSPPPTPVVVIGTVPPQSTYRADAAFERPSTASIAQLRAQQPEVAAPNRRTQHQHQDPTIPVPVERISLAPRRVDGAAHHQHPISPQPTDDSRTPSAPHIVDLSPQLSPPRGGRGGGAVVGVDYDAAQYSGPVRNANNPPVPARTFTVDHHQRGAVRSPERLIYAPPVTQSMMRDAAEQQPPQSYRLSDKTNRPAGGAVLHPTGAANGGSGIANRNNNPTPSTPSPQAPPPINHPINTNNSNKVAVLGGGHHQSTSRESSVLSPRQPSREWLEKAALEQKELARTFDAVYEGGPPRLSTTEQWVDTHIQFETACGLQRQGGSTTAHTSATPRNNQNSGTIVASSSSSRMTANIQSPRPSNRHNRGGRASIPAAGGGGEGAVVVRGTSSSAVASLRQQHDMQLSGAVVPLLTATNTNINSTANKGASAGVGGGSTTTSTVRRMMSPLKQ